MGEQRLGLWPDEAVEDGDAGPVRDGEIPMIRLRHTDPDQLAVLAKDRTDIRGEVAEEVSDVRVLFDASAG
jgi:hypothetical protein